MNENNLEKILNENQEKEIRVILHDLKACIDSSVNFIQLLKHLNIELGDLEELSLELHKKLVKSDDLFQELREVLNIIK